MTIRLPMLLLSSMMPLVGCAVATSHVASTQSLTGNWQIQSGTAITSTSAGPVFLVGALEQSGSQVTGTFTGATICPSPAQTAVNFSGSVDSAGNLSLATASGPSVSVQLAVPANPTSVASGNLVALGGLCALALDSPAVGVQIAPLTGTFVGAASATAPAAPIPSGSLSLALTQSSTPNASGQFPVAGTLLFTGAGCTSSLPVTGTISGEGITLASASAPVSGQNYVSLTAAASPTATLIVSSAILFQPSPCSTVSSTSTTYTGTLTTPLP